MKKNFFLPIILSAILLPNVSSADAMDDCMTEEINKMAEVKPFTDNEQGCETKATGSDGARHACDATVCYKAPPGWAIKGQVTANDSSRVGSEHTISAIFYEYNSYGQTERACVNVHARGPHGHAKGRGWQNVKLSGEIEKIPSIDAIKQVAKLCAKKTSG